MATNDFPAAGSYATGVLVGFLAHPDNGDLVDQLLANARAIPRGPLRTAGVAGVVRMAILRAAGFDLIAEIEAITGDLEQVDWIFVVEKIADLVIIRNEATSPLDGSPLRR